MNNEITRQAPRIRVSAREVSTRLGAAIVATAEYCAYSTAEQSYQNDVQARELLARYEDAQRTIQLSRQLGSDTREEAQRMEDLQRAIEANQTLKNYFSAQEELVTLLRELNEFLSERLNLDFAGLTKPRSGCCS